MYLNEDEIWLYIERFLGTDLCDLEFYRVVPRGYPIPEAPVVFTKNKSSLSLNDLEAALGFQLPALPSNLELRRKIAGLGGAEAKYERRQVFEPAPVADLPAPHNPYRCAHKNRFNSIVGEAGWVSRSEAGRRFIDSLTPSDINACWWHQAGNWLAIANESVRVIETVGQLKRQGDYFEEARRSGLPGQDLKWLESLFDDPIIVAGGGYTEGQHRACALRFSGASRAAVVTGYENVAIRRNDWQYEGDG